MMYFMFQELRTDITSGIWYVNYIDYKDIENISKKFYYNKNIYSTIGENSITDHMLSLVTSNDLKNYLKNIKKYLVDPSWIDRFLDHLRIYYPEIYLLIEIEGI